MTSARRESFPSRLIKNFLVYSSFYLVVQSVASMTSNFVPPMLGWLGLLLAAILITELVLVTVRKSRAAVLSISPSLVLVLLVAMFPVYSALQEGPIEWTIRSVAICVGITVYCVGLLLSIAFGLRSSVRQDLLSQAQEDHKR
jgi:hypothetical protein